jgi:hypothetical protein
MTGFAIVCMVASLLILPAFIILHVIKSHDLIQPVEPLYLRLILVNWTLTPIAFAFTFFLVPYTLFADNPLSFYSMLPSTGAFPKAWHGFTILALAFIFGLFGFLLCFYVVEKLYLKCFITRSGDSALYIKSLYWFSSWGCLVILWAIIGMDLYAAFAAQNTAIAAALLPVTLFILALPLYFTE